MGSNFSKNTENTTGTQMKGIPPNKNLVSTPPSLDVSEIEENPLDPRSPHICRTPINEIIRGKCAITKNQNLSEISTPPGYDNPSSILRAKLIKELNYNLLDPRSPSQLIDRTPITFNENDDQPVYVEVDDTEEGCPDTTTNSVEIFEEPPVFGAEILAETPIINTENKRDPRSPSFGVERTPIFFADEISDSDIFESVQQKLTVNEIENRPLERVKNRLGRTLQRTGSSGAIYEDKEQVFSTPKRNESRGIVKRTPLSCVANKSHLRSKSLENSAKSLKGKIPPTSYDDYNLKGCRNTDTSNESFQINGNRCLNI